MLEAREDLWLDPRAARAAHSRGRQIPEPSDGLRTAFQRDRDRILHCKAFRRMKHKTQVFVSPELDHYRTRLTHTLEVTQVARTVTRALRLNEDLTEAIGMGHDMGHAPFGHDGEYALDEAYRKYVPDGQFRHYEQSLRIADKLERDGRGLNLTWEVRDGILYHSKGKKNLNAGGTSHWKTEQDLAPTGNPAHADLGTDAEGKPRSDVPETLEGQILRMCDRIAYVNHDIDDAIRAGMMSAEDLPQDIIAILGEDSSKRITAMVGAVISASTEIIDGERRAKAHIEMDDEIREATDELKNWMFKNVYMRKTAIETPKVRLVVMALFERFMEQPQLMHGATDYDGLTTPELARIACDYVAGMTDRYASQVYADLFLPASWRGV